MRHCADLGPRRPEVGVQAGGAVGIARLTTCAVRSTARAGLETGVPSRYAILRNSGGKCERGGTPLSQNDNVQSELAEARASARGSFDSRARSGWTPGSRPQPLPLRGLRAAHAALAARRREAPGRIGNGAFPLISLGGPDFGCLAPFPIRSDLVPKGGLEPPRDNSHTPLKRTCLPFHHFGSGEDRQNSRLPDAEL